MYFLSTCWLPFLTVSSTHLPLENGRHFGRRPFQMHFLMKMIEFRFEFHWFFPMSLIDNKLILVQVMAWHRRGDKPRHYQNQCWHISVTHLYGNQPQWVNYFFITESLYFPLSEVWGAYWENITPIMMAWRMCCNTAHLVPRAINKRFAKTTL